ncbi:MAG: ribosome recycling factor [bacterium]|jgi:ribosome recycling factor
MVEDLLKDAEKRMQQAVEHASHDFQTFRTGRANPMMLERITVDYFGTPTHLNQLANISVPEPRQILITPWDKSAYPLIEKAIQKSDLGINPMSDSAGIRLNIPPLTEDRRKEMIKQLHKRGEEAHVAIRNVRRDINDHLKAEEKAKKISEDDRKRAEEKVQKVTDKYIEQATQLQKKKEEELLEV